MLVNAVKTRFSNIWFFVRQDLVDRYRSDWLGVGWLFVQPLIYVALFSAVFSTLIRSRIPGIESGYGYVIYLISGLLAWNMFSQSISRLSTWYRDRAHLYRKVAMGLITPPLSVLISEFVIYAVSMGIFAVFLLGVGRPFSWQWLWLPVMAALLLAMAFGVGLIFGLLEVFIPDIRRLVPIGLQIGFWLSPIVYTLDILSPRLQAFQQFNPIALSLQEIHRVALYGAAPEFEKLLFPFSIVVVFLTVLGWLQLKVKKALRDAL